MKRTIGFLCIGAAWFVIFTAQTSPSFGVAQKEIVGYDTIVFGLSRDQTIEAIFNNVLMKLPVQYINGKADVDMDETTNFLALQGNEYFKTGYFLFRNDALYSISVTFQESQFSFLDLYRTLTEKYGMGAYETSRTLVWTNGARRIVLERPSTVRYYDDGALTETLNALPERPSPLSLSRNAVLSGL